VFKGKLAYADTLSETRNTWVLVQGPEYGKSPLQKEDHHILRQLTTLPYKKLLFGNVTLYYVSSGWEMK
jgi:hypothetical protein